MLSIVRVIGVVRGRKFSPVAPRQLVLLKNMLSTQATMQHAARMMVAAVLILSASLHAGEKIRFSSPDGNDTAPLADPKEKPRFSPTGGIDNFRPTATEPGQMPFIPSSGPTTGAKKKGGREDDPATERREWIFNNMKEVENRGGKKSTKKDSEERDLDPAEKKEKTAMEEFFDSRTDKQKNSGKDGKSAKDADNNPARDPSAPPGLDAETANARPPGMRSNDGLGSSSRPRSGLSRAEGDSGKVSTEKSELRESFTESRATGPRSDRLMEREARAEEFGRLLNPSGPPGGASPGLGSFNFSSGGSLQSASPLSQSSFDALLGKRPASALSGTLPGSGGSLKPAAPDDFGSRPAAAFSAPPPVFTPSTELPPPPRPSGILEVPKRRQ
ncbi:MAG: hypothetical protein HZA89_13375 [Verrucomicrobia bacterium]|nr:hypothetical protein [Verrucomicrobiota bacterium]